MWIHLDPPESEVFVEAAKEIDKTDSDRAAAIVAATFVEDHITRLVQWHLEQDEKLLGELFKPGSPLGDFGVKVNLGYLLGLYSKVAWKELYTIRTIRNKFAHKLEVRDFKNDKMRGLTENLKLWETKKIKIAAPDGLHVGAGLAVKLVVTIGEKLEIGEREAVMFMPETASITTRARFVNACKFYIAAVGLLIHVPKKQKAPLF